MHGRGQKGQVRVEWDTSVSASEQLCTKVKGLSPSCGDGRGAICQGEEEPRVI